VRERLREQRGILEAVADASLEYRVAGHRCDPPGGYSFDAALKSMYTPMLATSGISLR
jgi:hypothetical protein